MWQELSCADHLKGELARLPAPGTWLIHWRDGKKDLSVLEKSIGDGDPEKSSLYLFSLEMFENIAYVMAKHADPSIPDNPEDWLDEFNTFNIYQVLPKLIELWGMNIRTDVEAKKNFMQQTVK